MRPRCAISCPRRGGNHGYACSRRCGSWRRSSPGPAPTQEPGAGRAPGRVSSSRRRTWRARSRLFYTPPTPRPPDVPPGRPSIASPLSTPILSDYDPESELSRLSQSAGEGPVRGQRRPLRRARALASDVRTIRRCVRRHDRPGGPALAAGSPRPQAAGPRAARRGPAAGRLRQDGARPGGPDRPAQKAGDEARRRRDRQGYAAQAALDVLKKAGITRALVGGAGDIVVGDPPPDAARLDRSPSRRSNPASPAPHAVLCCWPTRRSRPRATPSGS